MDIRINATPHELAAFITELQAGLSEGATMEPDVDYDMLASAFHDSPYMHITKAHGEADT